MRKLLGWLCALFGATSYTPSWAYETSTHAAMTHVASANSRVTGDPATSPLFASLGLLEFAGARPSEPFGKSYVHLEAPMQMRAWHSIERDVMKRVRNVLPMIAADHTVTGWIVAGAIREDDNHSETRDSDEPWGVFNRVFGHFFDPYVDRGLDVANISSGPKARDWALSSNALADLRRNYYAAPHAREAMWRALTLTTPVASGGLSADVFPPEWSLADKEGLRRAYWATTFRALGHVIHPLQDMAQPQHTRNDMHTGLGCVGGGCAFGHSSFYEKYMAARTLREGTISLPSLGSDEIRVSSAQLSYEGYPAVSFGSFEAYFASATGATGVASGKGLANYSNRNFYTFGTNAGSDAAQQFPSPHPTADGLGDLIDLNPTDMVGNPLNAEVTFKVASASDYAASIGDQDNVRITTYGAWSQFLQANDEAPSYTLNVHNYDDMAGRLVKRAVGYTAGLINYFFRGKLKLGLPADGVYAVVDQHSFDPANPMTGFRKVKVRVQNDTDPIGAVEQHMTGGRLVAVLKYRLNRGAYSPDLSSVCDAPDETQLTATCRGQTEEILVSSATTLPDGSPANAVTLERGAPPLELHFAFDTGMPLNVTDVQLQLVYRGPLGAEAEAVAVGTQNISEPTYISLLNASNTLACVNGVYVQLNADGSFPDPVLAARLQSEGWQVPGPTVVDRVALSFKEPFPEGRLWPNGAPPLPTVRGTDLQAGTFVRVAVLADDGDMFGRFTKAMGEMSEFARMAEFTFPTHEIGKFYPGNVSELGLPRTALRGSFHQNYLMGVASAGTGCNPRAADGFSDAGPYVVPVQVAATINF